jgi:long-chain acyl-CoA synthetase
MSRFSEFLNKLSDYTSKQCIDGDDGSQTYIQLIEAVTAWSTRFDEFEVAAGTVVGVRSNYSLQAIAAVLALLARNAVVAMIPRDRDVSIYLTDAHATALLEFCPSGTYQWRRISHATTHLLIEKLRSQGDGGIILFTSGSSGRPKAALQSLERFLYKLRNPGRPYRTLAFMLFDHIGGLDITFHTLVAGGTLILTRRRDPEAVLDVIERYRVEALPTSPSFLRLLCATPMSLQHDTSTLKVISYSSEPMDTSTLVRLSGRFPNARITQKYGTTETGSPQSISRTDNSLWLKFKDGIETKIIDGVLWIRTESAILGYLNATSPVDEDGWYCTGDQVDVDGEWIRVRGRVSDTINVGGEKASPTEIEQVILEQCFVRAVIVFSEKHPLMGQVVAAEVSVTPGFDTKDAAARIRRHCRQRLAPHKIPVRILFTDQDLTSARQKLQRRGGQGG